MGPLERKQIADTLADHANLLTTEACCCGGPGGPAEAAPYLAAAWHLREAVKLLEEVE